MLAAGALVASILSVGAAPAAAGEQQPDARSEWLACVGAAKAGNDFTDVSMDSVHYDSISCLAYYGITTGKTADTYDPNSNVTRSQMALFLTRAADKAGIDLGDAMDMGFTDLGMSGADRVAAINVLASKGIMPGRTATTFDPEGLVTRADMAQHLFTLLDLALDSVHIDTLTIDGDGTGIEVNVSGGDGMRPDDYFGDVRRTQPAHIADMINAVYELGVTTGTNGMTGDMGTFEPEANVTRAQMASFIMRALGHTNLRPSGFTVQQTADDTQISVRDAAFKPVVDQRVEMITTNYPEDAFDRNGRCITSRSFVTGTINDVNTSGFGPCEIDGGDERTDGMGNVVFENVGSLAGSRASITCAGGGSDNKFVFTGAPGAPATVWAWTGDHGDIVDQGTDLVEPVAGNAANPGRATQYTVSGGTKSEVKMGSTLTYEIQLKNRRGQPVGPTPGVNNSFLVTILIELETAVDDNLQATPTVFLRQTTPHSPDGSGKITIPVSYRDPTPYPTTTNTTANNEDARVSITVAAATGNSLMPDDDTVSGDTGAAAGVTASAIFSDNASAPNSLKAESAPWRLRSPANRNTISVTVLDQYGDPYRGGHLQVAPTDSTTAADFQVDPPTDTTAMTYTVPASGRRTIAYTHNGTGALTQTVEIALQYASTHPDVTAGTVAAGDAVQSLATAGGTAAAGIALTSANTNAVVVRWADRATTAAAAANVLVGDPGANFVVVTAATPEAFQYGADDTFLVNGQPVTLQQFDEILGSFGSGTSDPVSSLGTLTSARYDFNQPRDRAEWSLTGVTCRPAAADR